MITICSLELMGDINEFHIDLKKKIIVVSPLPNTKCKEKFNIKLVENDFPIYFNKIAKYDEQKKCKTY